MYLMRRNQFPRFHAVSCTLIYIVHFNYGAYLQTIFHVSIERDLKRHDNGLSVIFVTFETPDLSRGNQPRQEELFYFATLSKKKKPRQGIIYSQREGNCRYFDKEKTKSRSICLIIKTRPRQDNARAKEREQSKRLENLRDPIR